MYRSADPLKRKLRQLKKLEITVRFKNRSIRRIES